jgi:tubulin---tyrosine ligase
MLIRSLFKSRYWWTSHDKEEPEKVNFLWTQIRRIPIMQAFKCKLTKKDAAAVDFTPKRKNRRLSQLKEGSHAKEDGGKPSEKEKANEGVQKLEPYPTRIYNKLEDNYHLANKKALLLNMKNYCEAVGEDPFDALPVTFHVKSGLDDPEFKRFTQYY